MNQLVVTSGELRSSFALEVVALRFPSSVGDIGRPGWTKASKALEAWLAIFWHCLARRPALAYFTLSPTGLAFWRDLSFVAILKAFRIPIAFHLHGKGLGRDQAPAFQRLCYQWTFQGTTVVLLSPLLYPEIEDIVSITSCRFIPNGVPDIPGALWNKDPRQVPMRPRALFLSNMVPEKGIFDLVEAVRSLRDSGIGLDVTFVGPFLSGTTQREFFRRVRMNKLEADITWLGSAYGDARIRHLLEADLFVFPSYYGPEAFPLVVLEAMSAGLPVIASDVGAIPEMVDHGVTGLVVPAKDTTELASAIKSLLSNPSLRSSMGAQARLRYEREYREDRFLDRMKSLLHELTRSSPAVAMPEPGRSGPPDSEEVKQRMRVG